MASHSSWSHGIRTYPTSEREKELALEDMSMLIRMMVTKHRRGKLDEEYCQKALDYLQRKGLQGNIIKAMETTMQPHQQRVIDEKAELSDKLDKLETFEGGPIYSGLPPAEQSRLSRQLLIMKLYEQVLSERISAFEV